MFESLKNLFPNHIFFVYPDEEYEYKNHNQRVCSLSTCPKCHIKERFYSLDHLKDALPSGPNNIKSCDAGIMVGIEKLLLLEFAQSINTHSFEVIKKKTEDTLITVERLLSDKPNLDTVFLYYIYNSPDYYFSKILLDLSMLNSASYNYNKASKRFSAQYNNKTYSILLEFVHCRDFKSNYQSIKENSDS